MSFTNHARKALPIVSPKRRKKNISDPHFHSLWPLAVVIIAVVVDIAQSDLFA